MQLRMNKRSLEIHDETNAHILFDNRINFIICFIPSQIKTNIWIKFITRKDENFDHIFLTITSITLTGFSDTGYISVVIKSSLLISRSPSKST